MPFFPRLRGKWREAPKGGRPHALPAFAACGRTSPASGGGNIRRWSDTK